jgi:DNA-binding FrmR family transcriptional regulator
MINKSTQQETSVRLRRIAGQIAGIEKMIEDGRYCIDIINQITAVEKALKQVSLLVMKRHVESCVAEAIKSGKSAAKIKELMETVERATS